MSANYDISLLGNVEIRQNNRVVAFTVNKAKALLAYLAVKGGQQPRPVLATLLWANKPDQAALANLRMALSQIRRVLPEILTTTRSTAALNGSIVIRLDIDNLATVSRKVQKQGVTKQNVAAAETAVSLYRGDFLADVYISDAPEFESWLQLERERWQQLALTIGEALVTFALENGRYHQGISHGRQILELAPWREDIHRALMRLLAANGQRAAALAQFEACRQALATELAVKPTAATEALAEAIRRGEWAAAPKTASAISDHTYGQITAEAPTPPHSLPAPTLSFVGRKQELVQIKQLLNTADCRLLTLIGPGGAGKTRLGLAAAQQILVDSTSQFSDGIFFVPLATVYHGDELAMAIGQAIGLELAGENPPENQLQRYWQDKKMLLLLDNFEQLTAYSTRLADWLELAPGLKFLVTSRERLQLVEEWLLDVAGLPVPASGERVDSQAESMYPSLQLFQERARRINLGFDLSAEQEAVIDICQMADGLPLAIELAAVWVRTFSCSDIAWRIRQNLDFLTNQARNRPARHASLRATFNHSWDLLTPQEQAVLPRLTVFHGGFTLAAAQAVTASLPRLLANLVDKSLVQRGSDGRYDLHPLMRELAAEKLTGQPLTTRQTAHARYFIDLLTAETAVLRGPEPEAAADHLLPELDNLRQAWRTVVQGKDTTAIAAALVALFELYDLRAWYAEGEQLLGLAAAAVPHALLLKARIDAFQGRFLTRLGRLSESENLHRAALPLLAEQGDLREYGDALNGLNNVLRLRGEYAAARDLLEQARQVYEEAGFDRGVASVLNNLGLVAYRQGEIESAIVLQQRSVALFRQTGPAKDLATVLNNLGLSLMQSGQHAMAEKMLQESAAAAAAIDYDACVVVATQNMGLAALRLQRYELAEKRLQHSLALANEVGVMDMAGHIHDDLAALYRQLGQLEAARMHGEAALSIGEAQGIRWLAASAQSELADVALATGDLLAAKSRLQAGLPAALKMQAKPLIAHMLLSWANWEAKQGAVVPALSLVTALLPHLQEDPGRREAAVRLQTELWEEVDLATWEQIQAVAAEKDLWSWATVVTDQISARKD